MNQNIKNILIFHALELGDLLCAIPAFRALRHHFPKVHIALLGLGKASCLSFPSLFKRVYSVSRVSGITGKTT